MNIGDKIRIKGRMYRLAADAITGQLRLEHKTYPSYDLRTAADNYPGPGDPCSIGCLACERLGVAQQILAEAEDLA